MLAGGDELPLDIVLHRIFRLVATGTEELYPIVRSPAMTGGEADAKLGIVHRRQECDRSGWRDSNPDNVHARACQPGDDGRFEELAGRAGITPDDRNGRRAATIWAGENLGGRDGQIYGQVGTQVPSGYAPDPIGPEEAGRARLDKDVPS
jgi:hypothetical protein